MPIYGIIAEFNPFHNGHKYLIECAKDRGADAIVCVMSGNAVQRGEVALADKYKRAHMALLAGADLVVELPYPYSSASAERFAMAGVRILSELADIVFFGSECGDMDRLKSAAKITASKAFVNEYKSSLTDNCGTASTYFELLEKKTGYKYLSNDILGIEYIKAALRMNKQIAFETTSRIGNDYASSELFEGDLQSASAIRRLVAEGNLDTASAYMPKESFDILVKAVEEREITDISKLDTAIKLFFRMTSPESISASAECDTGIASRLCNAAWEFGDKSMLDAARTKRYTDARLRRAMLFALTGVKSEDVCAPIEYVNLLGANARGRELLAKHRKEGGLPILAKATDVPNTKRGERQFELSSKLDAVFSLALAREKAPTELLKTSPVII
ncbi:MAG: nucleotidyltransferase family protein [Clostridia bacterium]|nr:nucleotidyltransferase family protein [Clostridia bacterium]